MPDSHDVNSGSTASRRLCDVAVGTGAATIVVSLLVVLLMETARRGVSSAVFRYVGF